MTDDAFNDQRLTAMGLLIEVYEGLTARTEPVLSDYGLSGNDFDTLIRLARSPGNQLRMTDLAAQTSRTTSGMTRIVDRLERGGLVSRQACPGDRRSALAVLTETGATRLSDLLPAHLATIDRWFTAQLTPAQLEALLDALQTVRTAVRPDAAAGARS